MKDEPSPRKPTLIPVIVFACLLGLLLAYNTMTGGMPFGRPDPVMRRTQVMGTDAHVTVYPSVELDVPSEKAVEDAFAAMDRVERLMSPFIPSSGVSAMNNAKPGEWVAVDPALWGVMMQSLRLHRLSEGAFDVTVGPLLQLYDYKTKRMDSLPSDESIADALTRVGSDKILWKREGMRLALPVKGMRVDLGAIAKGYAVDLAMEALRQNGVKNAMVEAGGEVRLIGNVPIPDPAANARQEVGTSGSTAVEEKDKPSTRKWRVGIKHPRSAMELVRELELSDCAVATSGDYEKFLEIDGTRYSHIIDPRTGKPLAGGVVSATVIHPESCLMADGLATTFSVLGVEGTQVFLERLGTDLKLGGLRVYLYTLEGEDGLREHVFTVSADGTSVERIQQDSE